MSLHEVDKSEVCSLRDLIQSSDARACIFQDPIQAISLDELAGRLSLVDALSEFAGRSVVVASRNQMFIASAVIALDGMARRITLCPGDLTAGQLSSVTAKTEADAVISECPGALTGSGKRVQITHISKPPSSGREPWQPTEWILLTSGTTNLPKLVVHNLASLTAAIRTRGSQSAPVIWGTFYDVCRYGGLQILLRAILSPASFVLTEPDEQVNEYLERLKANRATHILGTPTHWRRAIMSPLARELSPQYVRLSGEVADQSILTALRALYPTAIIAHAFASTETGVAFEVRDELEGFPAEFLTRESGQVRVKVKDGSFHISSPGNASRYLGDGNGRIRDADGYVDTGDAVELRNGRYYFLGRTTGVINVGGLKVHPEEVESVINRHPQVQMSRVRARRNSFIGSIVVADVVLKGHSPRSAADELGSAIKTEILQICRAALPRHKIPTAISIVPSLAVGPTGKVLRSL